MDSEKVRNEICDGCVLGEKDARSDYLRAKEDGDQASMVRYHDRWRGIYKRLLKYADGRTCLLKQQQFLHALKKDELFLKDVNRFLEVIDRKIAFLGREKDSSQDSSQMVINL